MLSKTLKKLRENSGYTQQQVADALNIDRSTYAYYETGKTTPDINTIIKLSKIFNVPYTEIFESEEKNVGVRFKDISSEEESFISKYSRKNNKHIYELTKREQQVVIGYRLLSVEAQEKLLNDIYEKTRELSKRRRNKQ